MPAWIARLVRDPVWWVSVVFVPLLLIFVAPWIKDVVRRWLSRLSDGLAQARADEIATRLSQARWASADTVRMTHFGIRIILTFLIFLGALFVFAFLAAQYPSSGEWWWFTKALAITLGGASYFTVLRCASLLSNRLDIYYLAYCMFFPDVPPTKRLGKLLAMESASERAKAGVSADHGETPKVP